MIALIPEYDLEKFVKIHKSIRKSGAYVKSINLSPPNGVYSIKTIGMTFDIGDSVFGMKLVSGHGESFTIEIEL